MRKINIREEICYCITAYLHWVCQNSTYLKQQDPEEKKKIRGLKRGITSGGYAGGEARVETINRKEEPAAGRCSRKIKIPL
jgi:hypothetical protein